MFGESEAHTDTQSERGSPSLVGRGIANPQEEFLTYLKAQNKRNAKQIMCYAQRYYHVIATGDATAIASLSSGALRRHAMEALTSLSKYLGCYDRWQQIRKRYSLHWTNGDESLHALQRFFDPNLSLDYMFQKIREMVNRLPCHMSRVILFGTLIGLRPAETVQAVRLINDPEAFKIYYDPVQQCLVHYKFPSQFLKPTKKCYLSFVNDQILGIAKIDGKTPSYEAIRKACKRRSLSMNMRFTRKLFASWLRKEGIAPEIVDLLQGRVSQSILTRHYLAPSQNMKDDVLQALEKLQRSL